MKDRVEFHRKSWTELDSVYATLLTQGSGEAITDPIYFGKKFYDKPLFTYSSDLSTVATPELSSTADIRDYNHQLTWKHQRPNPFTWNPWYDRTTETFPSTMPGMASFAGWWLVYGDKPGISIGGAPKIYWARFSYDTNHTGVGAKLYMANVLADFSTLADPATNNWVPITGRVKSGTQVQYTTSFEYSSDLTPTPVPHGHINFVWYTSSGAVISTSSSSAIPLTTSVVEHSYAANPPAGTTYVAIYVDVHGDGGGSGPSGFGDYMYVNFNRADYLDVVGVAVPTELMPSTYGDQVGHMTDGGFEHQGWLGYIPSWDVGADHIWDRDFKGWWVQSPPLGTRSYEDEHFLSYYNREIDPFSYTYAQNQKYGEETLGVQYPMLGVSSTDNYENIRFNGNVIEPFQGWPWKMQIDNGGRPIYVRDDGTYTYFEPRASGATLPNDMQIAVLHLDEPHSTANPWRIRVDPGDYYRFGGKWYVNPYTPGQLEVQCHLDYYSSSNSFLGTSATVSQPSAEGWAQLNGGISDTVTQLRLDTSPGYWLFPDFMTGSARYPFVIQIDSEKMLVTSLVGSYYQIQRGYDSTTPASHTNGTKIYQLPPIGYFEFDLDLIVPASIGGGTPHWAVPRYSWVNTSTGDYPEMGIMVAGTDTPYGSGVRAVFEFANMLPSGMGVYSQATSEWLIRREGPEPRLDSEWCAYYKFGSETDSRWLSYSGADQVDYSFDLYPEFGPPYLPENHIMDDYVGTSPFVWWDSHQSRSYWNYFSNGIYWRDLYNPKVENHYYQFGVWADSPVEIEMRVWEMNSYGMFGEQYGLEGPALTTHNLQHGGSGWEVFEVKSPLVFISDFYTAVLFFLRIRGGSPGQVVKLDNFRASYDWTNDQENLNITIGVAEWLQDDRELYVGARLWLKVE